MSFNPTTWAGESASFATAAAPYMGTIERAAKQYGVDAGTLSRLINAESSFNPNVTSKAGAQGLGQFMPDTAKSMGITNPFDPMQSIMGAARYYAQLKKRFKDDRLAIAAYNAGPGTIERYGGIPPWPETQNYVNKILGAPIVRPNLRDPEAQARRAEGPDATPVANEPLIARMMGAEPAGGATLPSPGATPTPFDPAVWSAGTPSPAPTPAPKATFDPGVWAGGKMFPKAAPKPAPVASPLPLPPTTPNLSAIPTPQPAPGPVPQKRGAGLLNPVATMGPRTPQTDQPGKISPWQTGANAFDLPLEVLNAAGRAAVQNSRPIVDPNTGNVTGSRAPRNIIESAGLSGETNPAMDQLSQIFEDPSKTLTEKLAIAEAEFGLNSPGEMEFWAKQDPGFRQSFASYYSKKHPWVTGGLTALGEWYNPAWRVLGLAGELGVAGRYAGVGRTGMPLVDRGLAGLETKVPGLTRTAPTGLVRGTGQLLGQVGRSVPVVGPHIGAGLDYLGLKIGQKFALYNGIIARGGAAMHRWSRRLDYALHNVRDSMHEKALLFYAGLSNPLKHIVDVGGVSRAEMEQVDVASQDYGQSIRPQRPPEPMPGEPPPKPSVPPAAAKSAEGAPPRNHPRLLRLRPQKSPRRNVLRRWLLRIATTPIRGRRSSKPSVRPRPAITNSPAIARLRADLSGCIATRRLVRCERSRSRARTRSRSTRPASRLMLCRAK